jgi:hypothetical protein
VHVIYAVPADGEDHFSAIATPIVADLGALDAWWRREDPTRTPRFDLFAFPGCPSGLDGLDISSVRLPHEADYYRPIEERQGRLAGDLGAAFSDPGKKYLVYYDGAVAEPYDCGQSAVAPTTGDAAAYSFVYQQAESCTHDLGAGEGEAVAARPGLPVRAGVVPATTRARPSDSTRELRHCVLRRTGAARICIDRSKLGAGLYRYAAFLIDQWGSSAPQLSNAVRVPKPRTRPKPRRTRR